MPTPMPVDSDARPLPEVRPVPTPPQSTPLAAWWLPLVAGVVSAGLSWYVWASLRQTPLIADEAAYVLQSTILARGRWVAPAPPLPQFFEQAHVLLRPAIAAKYSPGHSLLLAPGTALGFPGFVPVLLVGLTGGLVFALARRVAGAAVGLLTWLIWSSMADVSRFHASYMSEITTGACWVLAWWALLRWWEDGAPRWLLAMAVAISWSAITRPLTGLALGVPIVVVVLHQAARRHIWRELGVSAIAGLAILGIVPVWSARTTGDWRLTPLLAYTRAYMPSDRPGFGLSDERPTIPLPPDQASVEQVYRNMRAAHTPSALPRILLERLRRLATNFCGSGWRLALAPLFALGLFGLDRRGRFALAGGGMLILLYLSYAHPASWTVYYLEIAPVFAFVAAIGGWQLLQRFPRAWGPMLTLVACILLAGGVAQASYEARNAWASLRAPERRFAGAVQALTTKPAIIFVRYAPAHTGDLSLIRNEPFLDEAPYWFVYDRGAENARLMAAAPDRAAYLADETTQQITLIRPAASPSARALY